MFIDKVNECMNEGDPLNTLSEQKKYNFIHFIFIKSAESWNVNLKALYDKAG